MITSDTITQTPHGNMASSNNTREYLIDLHCCGFSSLPEGFEVYEEIYEDYIKNVPDHPRIDVSMDLYVSGYADNAFRTDPVVIATIKAISKYVNVYGEFVYKTNCGSKYAFIEIPADLIAYAVHMCDGDSSGEHVYLSKSRLIRDLMELEGPELDMREARRLKDICERINAFNKTLPSFYCRLHTCDMVDVRGSDLRPYITDGEDTCAYVYNACFGGFTLSDAFWEVYCQSYDKYDKETYYEHSDTQEFRMDREILSIIAFLSPKVCSPRDCLVVMDLPDDMAAYVTHTDYDGYETVCLSLDKVMERFMDLDLLGDAEDGLLVEVMHLQQGAMRIEEIRKRSDA